MGPEQAGAPEVGLPFSVEVGVWPWVRDLGVVVVVTAAALLSLALVLVHGAVWLAIPTVALSVLGVGIGVGLWRRPLVFSFDREVITVRRVAGVERFQTDRLEAVDARPGGHAPRLILRFSDGGRLVIPERQIRGAVAELRERLHRHLLPLTVRSPWPRVQDRLLRTTAFGPGSTRPFSAYLEGPSAVVAASVEDVVTWLQGCEYVSDQEAFGRADVWQHPTDFERTRRGDCEDHALWAWRKLVGLGLEAELVVGTRKGTPHAWVTFAREGSVFLLEPSAKSGRQVWPAIETVAVYQPRFGVNRHLVTYRYRQPRDDARRAR